MRNNERATMQAAAQNVGELLSLTQAEVRAYRAEVAAYRAEVEAGRAAILAELRRIADSMGFLEVDVADLLKLAKVTPVAALAPPPLPTVTDNGDHTAVDIEQFDG